MGSHVDGAASMCESRRRMTTIFFTPSHGLIGWVRPRMKATVGSRLPGGVEMKGSRVFPRATSILRSVMVAGAGMAIWMALSAASASADSGQQVSHSLLGEVSSTVSSVTATAKNATAPTISVPVPSVPLPAAVKKVIPAEPISVHVPAVTPIVQQAGSSADEIIGTIPVANQLVPGDTTGGIVNAVVVPITGSVDEAAETLVPPVTDVLRPVALEPVTEVTTPILQPIVDAVDSVSPPAGPAIPPMAPTLPPLLSGDGSVAGTVTPGSGTIPGSAVGIPAVPVAASQAAGPQASTSTGQRVRASVLSTTGVPPVLSISHVLSSRGSIPVTKVQPSAVLPDPPADPRLALEAVPAGVAGAGSNSSQNGPPSPAAAFLHEAMIVPVDALPGLSTDGDEQHPEPVCFDPGSSPD